MPPNAASEMIDCVPLKQGGLRAFYEPATTHATTGIDAVANEVSTGLFVRGGVPLRTGASGDGADRYLATVDPSLLLHKLYRMDGSAGETTWKQEAAPGNYETAVASTSVRSTQFDYFEDSSGNQYVLYVQRGGGAAAGLYRVAYVGGALPVASDGDQVKIAGYNGPLAVNQARILIGEGNSERIYYTGTGSVTAPGAIDFIDVEPNRRLVNLAAIVAIAPDDLLVMKEGAPWVQISGDITNASTPVREMGQDYVGRFTEQVPVRVPGGIAIIEPGGDIYLTDGRNFTNISHMLSPFYKVSEGSGVDVVSPGQMAWLGGFLFVPGGYVRDWETGAWFKLSSFDAAFWTAEPYLGEVFGVTQGKSFSLKSWKLYEGQGDTRMHTYSWTSAPFSNEDGRQVAIREVQLFVACSATSDISVTVGGVTKTVTGLAAGRHQVPFYFRERGEMLTAKVVPSAQSAANEAPIVERIRVGMVDGHQLR